MYEVIAVLFLHPVGDLRLKYINVLLNIFTSCILQSMRALKLVGF